MKRRQLVLLLGGGSAAAASAGTGAFSSVSADREVNVNVVEDEEAYLSITVDDENDAVRIRNQFADDLDLTVTLESTDGVVDEVEVAGPITFVDGTSGDGDFEGGDDDDDGVLGPGEAAHVRVEFDGVGEHSVTFSFEGEASGASVDKTREFALGPEDVTDRVEKVKFPGNSGKVRVLTTENDGGGGGVEGVVSAKSYCEDDDGAVRSSDGFEVVSVNTDLRVDDFDDDDLRGSIVGIEIERVGLFTRESAGNNGITSNATGSSAEDVFGDDLVEED